MSSTTQEDYFGDTVDEKPTRRHHRKRRVHVPDANDSDVSPGEVVVSEEETIEYTKPKRHHSRRRDRDTVDNDYTWREPVAAENDSEAETTDDEEARRRRRRRRRRRQQKYEDGTEPGVASTAESATDGEGRDVKSSSPSGVKDRAKHAGETALAALGLEEAFKNTKERARSRTRSFSRGRRHSDEGYDSDAPRDRSRSRMNSNTAQAAILAAAVEAFRARKEKGGLTGPKGLTRVVEAALASGAIEGFLGRNGRDNNGNSTMHIAEAVLGGLAAQRGINGPRRKSRGRHDESSPLKDLAASGLIAAAGKKILDYQRSRSQSAHRGRDRDGERPGFDRKRSHSVGGALAALGLGGVAAERLSKDRREERRDRDRNQSDRDDRRDSFPQPLRKDDGQYTGAVGVRDKKSRRQKRPGIRDDDSSSSDSLSDSDLELDEESERKRHKLLRQKEIIGIALAIIATLHLGHAGYEAKEKRAERREMLESGKISEEESQKIKRKSLFSDAATVGLAVLAATEAVKAWKDMNKRRKQCHEFEKKRPMIEERRKRKLQGGDGEASKYYSQPGYLGPPPGVPSAVPVYPYYPTSGPIPVSRGQDSYATRDGRSIPVVYPSSVHHV